MQIISMGSPLQNPVSPALPPDKSPIEAIPTVGHTSKESSPQAVAELPSISNHFPSPKPSVSAVITPTTARKRKIDQTEHPSRNEVRIRDFSKNNICDECRQINLDKVINPGSTYQDYSGVLIQKVDKRFRQQVPTDCPLCQILFYSRLFYDEDKKEWEEDGEDELRSFHFLSFVGAINPSTSEPVEYQQEHTLQCLAIVPSNWAQRCSREYVTSHFQHHGCSVVHHKTLIPDMFAVQNVSATFEPSLVVNWLHYCNHYHKNLCSKSRFLVSGLRLIDCETLNIGIAHPEDVYVALSYVWGSANNNNATKETGDTIDSTRLPPSLPAVISDAIKVTKLLGFRYLWIDKFCIDQHDAGNKHEQIKQMGLVYENAELAIVAAAGPGENHGLPGVGDTPRVPQLSATIGNFRVLSSMRHPHSSIRSSKWSTRGWTFQEALLSRRRLVFTDEQVYFECNAMNCYESVATPLDKLHTENKSQQLGYLRAGVFGMTSKEAFGGLDFNTLDAHHVFARYLAAVEEYSARELSYDVDSLDALTGIVPKFERGRHPYFHVWGLPYSLSVEVSVARSRFVNSLSWIHTQDCWDRTSKPRRRASFPSWSWAGWAGKVSFPFRTGPEADKSWFFSQVGNMSFEDESGSTLEFAQMVHQDFNETISAASPRVLVLQASVLPLSAFEFDPDMQHWRVFDQPTWLSLSQGTTDVSEFWEKLQEGGRWQCICIGNWMNFTFVMVLESLDGFWCRAGMFQIVEVNPNSMRSWIADSTRETFRIV